MFPNVICNFLVFRLKKAGNLVQDYPFWLIQLLSGFVT